MMWCVFITARVIFRSASTVVPGAAAAGICQLHGDASCCRALFYDGCQRDVGWGDWAWWIQWGVAAALHARQDCGEVTSSSQQISRPLSEGVHSFLFAAFLSPFSRPFSRWIWVSRYQNVSILDFIGAKDDGGDGDNCSYKMCKVPNRHNQQTNIRFYLQPGCPSCLPTNNVRALKENLCCL